MIQSDSLALHILTDYHVVDAYTVYSAKFTVAYT